MNCVFLTLNKYNYPLNYLDLGSLLCCCYVVAMVLLWTPSLFFRDITVPGTELFQNRDSGLNRRLCTKFQVILRTFVIATEGC